MKGKIIIILIIMNLILVGIIYNFINKKNVNNKKQILKEMTETEYESYITSLNQSHEDYANYIEESKKKIASALSDIGVETSNEETLETMASNIRSISGIPIEEFSASSYERGRCVVRKPDGTMAAQQGYSSEGLTVTGEYMKAYYNSVWTFTALKECNISYMELKYNGTDHKVVTSQHLNVGDTLRQSMDGAISINIYK